MSEMRMIQAKKWTALLLALACLLSMTACGAAEQAVDGNALMQVILEKVSFDTQIWDVGEDAALYFSGLPEGTGVRMYTGSGYFADRVALITVPDETYADTAMDSVKEHVEQLNHQFANYIPEEVAKIEQAVIWQQGVYTLLCVTSDHKTAGQIVDNAAEMTAGVIVTEPTTQPKTTEATTEAATEPATEVTTEATTEATTEPEPEGYAPLISQSGTYRNLDGTYIVDDSAFENYMYVAAAAESYTQIVNQIAGELEGQVDVYVMAIPTAIGIVMPDDIVQQMGDRYYDQSFYMQEIYRMLSDSIHKINCYDNLMRHRTEYLYFRTDFHWNGKAAYYAYEEWCKAKCIAPYTLEQRQLTVFENFWGGLYQKNTKKDPALRVDSVEAYHPYSQNIEMVVTDRKGEQFPWEVISDGNKLAESAKYCAFAAADNPLTVYNNPDVTDGSVGVVIKESFGNALMPYMVDHYSTLYEIDYRYWEGDIAQFCLEVGAKDVTFANNMGMIRASVLVAMLADNV